MERQLVPLQPVGAQEFVQEDVVMARYFPRQPRLSGVCWRRVGLTCGGGVCAGGSSGLSGCISISGV